MRRIIPICIGAALWGCSVYQVPDGGACGLACDAGRDGGEESDDADVDGGVQPDAGIDAGVCAQCPQGSPCSESTGCAFVCYSCARDADCVNEQYCKDPARLSSFCTRRLQPCGDAGPPEAAIVEFRLTASCPETAYCTVRGEFIAATNRAAISVSAEDIDGGVTTTALGELRAFDLQSLWAGVAQSMCLTTTSFAGEVGCFTHGGTIRVLAQAGGQTTSFEYTSRGSMQPPVSMESAIDQAILQMIELGRDAGVLHW